MGVFPGDLSAGEGSGAGRGLAASFSGTAGSVPVAKHPRLQATRGNHGRCCSCFFSGREMERKMGGLGWEPILRPRLGGSWHWASAVGWGWGDAPQGPRGSRRPVLVPPLPPPPKPPSPQRADTNSAYHFHLIFPKNPRLLQNSWLGRSFFGRNFPGGCQAAAPPAPARAPTKEFQAPAASPQPGKAPGRGHVAR